MSQARNSSRKVLLILPVGMEEAYILHRCGTEVVLNRRTSPPPGAVGRRVAMYAGTRIAGRDFFGAPNRAARDRALKALGRRIAAALPAYHNFTPPCVDVATYSQRIVATAILDGSSPTSKSPWWDEQGVAWRFRDLRVVKPMLPLAAGTHNSGFRTIEEEGDVVAWLRTLGAIEPADVGPYIYSRRRS